MRIILTILFILLIEGVYSQCGTPQVRTLTTTGPNEWYRGSLAGYNPGDTLKFMGTYYSVIEFYNAGGNYSCPFVIVANTNFHADVIRFKGGAHNFKILSTGSGSDTTTTRNITAGNVACDQADHIEVNGLRIYGGSIGFYNKMNVSYADQNSWYPNYPMTGNKLIGCFVHDIGGEGIYSGLTQENGYTVTSSWSGLDTVIVGNRTDSTEIAYNYITRTTWDGLQIAHSGYGNLIHHNIVTNFGTIDKDNQRAGIILGGDCNGSVYNNTIKNGTGNGIEIFGFGAVNVYNNIIDSVGQTDSLTDGEESIYANYHTVSYISRPALQLNIYDNAINHPRVRGAIRISTSLNDAPSVVINNTFCIPGASGSWQSTYLILDVPGTTNSNNILQCETPPSGRTNILRMRLRN